MYIGKVSVYGYFRHRQNYAKKDDFFVCAAEKLWYNMDWIINKRKKNYNFTIYSIHTIYNSIQIHTPLHTLAINIRKMFLIRRTFLLNENGMSIVRKIDWVHKTYKSFSSITYILIHLLPSLYIHFSTQEKKRKEFQKEMRRKRFATLFHLIFVDFCMYAIHIHILGCFKGPISTTP